MKTEKFKNKYRFFYRDCKTGVSHGLNIYSNQWISYWYQGKRKGFTLRKYKN
jgi:hypothetical protein